MPDEEMQEFATTLLTAMRAQQPVVRTVSRNHLPTICVVAVALIVPLCGWCMSLSNRVAVLESQSTSLQSASVEISALKQELTDFRSEFDSWTRSNYRTEGSDIHLGK